MTLSALGNLKRAGAAKRTRRSRSMQAGGGSATDAGKGGSRPSRKGKFNAAGERVDGIWMASAAEAERYRQLLRMEMAGKIDNLRTQVTYPLIVNNVMIVRYRADFSYDVIDDHGNVLRSVIEDVKGMVTPEFKIKHKLFNALEPVPLTLIELKGNAINSHTGQRDRVGWLQREWADRIPD